MNVGIHDSDLTGYPNLALMKLSAWHKAKGDTVLKYIALNPYDVVYSSKVFTWTESDPYLPEVTKRGGTGYGLFETLPDEIEHTCPDYNLYDIDYSMGFLTRGCPNKCSFCIVNKKEGKIRGHAELDEFLRHDKVVFLDNNVLASEHGIKQIEQLTSRHIKVDFNQGLDARLIDDKIAKLLSKVRWLKPVRLACDSKSQMSAIQKAVTLLRWHNTTPTRYFVYVLIKDIEDALERIKFIKGLGLDVHAQPYRDFDNKTVPSQEQKDLARWANHKAIFKSVAWEDYKTNDR